MATIFEKIIGGGLEGSFVYQDDICVVFMDLNPLNPGHLLVVPRKPVARLTALLPNTAAHLFEVAQKMVNAIGNSSLKSDGVNIFLADGEIAGQEVPHVHLHIVPRFAGDGIKVSFGKSFRQESRAELNRVAALISDAIE